MFRILLALLVLTSCSSALEPAVQGQGESQLVGMWAGQFPPEQGDEGVELYFQPDFAFFVQKGERVARQRLLVEQLGGQLRFTLTSETDPQNQAVFTGSFVAPDRIGGHYVNQFLGEDFHLTLVQRLAPSQSPAR